MEKKAEELIVNTINQKSIAKQQAYNNAFKTFKQLKIVLQEVVESLNKKLDVKNKNIAITYKDKGEFEAEIKVAGDLLIFSMHTNIFEFERNHGVWKISYVQDNKLNTYCGIINIYNFLADSFKYNRLEDIGYLIGRIFINHENHYFVEGKRQLGYLYNDFSNSIIDKEAIKNIIESAILFSLDFDLLVPPYESVNIASVQQINDNLNKSKVKTGKRLGFQFSKEDDSIS